VRAGKRILTIVGAGLLAGDGLGGLLVNLLVLVHAVPPMTAPWMPPHAAAHNGTTAGHRL
jgi:hypothetical protein